MGDAEDDTNPTRDENMSDDDSDSESDEGAGPSDELLERLMKLESFLEENPNAYGKSMQARFLIPPLLSALN